jgi:endoglucanase
MLKFKNITSKILTYTFLSTLVFSANILSCKNSEEIVPPETKPSIISHFGKLRVEGTKIVDKNGNPVVLRGMSLFWSQWIPKYYNEECIRWLRDDWKCTIIRAALAVDHGGYLENPATEMQKIFQVIDACINLGIYVVVDWHDHEAENHLEESKTFFRTIANKYGDKPNLIYEIYNEPLQVSWADIIKPYAQEVITEIRNIDPNNIIVVGTPNWSQDVDEAAKDPLAFDNIAYTLHFYTGTHRQSLRNKAIFAINNGLPLFVTEWGLSEASGTGEIDYVETNLWLEFVDLHQLSWCNWSIADKDETSAALKPGAAANGGWENIDLTPSGLFIRDEIRNKNSEIFDLINNPE